MIPKIIHSAKQTVCQLCNLLIVWFGLWGRVGQKFICLLCTDPKNTDDHVCHGSSPARAPPLLHISFWPDFALCQIWEKTGTFVLYLTQSLMAVQKNQRRCNSALGLNIKCVESNAFVIAPPIKGDMGCLQAKKWESLYRACRWPAQYVKVDDPSVSL